MSMGAMAGVQAPETSTKLQQYVLLPPRGLRSDSRELGDFFGSLGRVATVRSIGVAASFGVATAPSFIPTQTNIHVLDSIHEDGAKLVEMSPEGLATLRAAQPDVRIVPVVYYEIAVAPRPCVLQSFVTASVLPPTSFPIRVVSSDDGSPVAGASVIAFTNFAAKTGAQGLTDPNGSATLALSGALMLERLYVYPKGGWWPLLESNVSLQPGATVQLTRIDLSYQDHLRSLYGPSATPQDGSGVRIGVIDTGVGPHPDLRISGGANLVTGENPLDYGDNGIGHGTHVAGIIGARGGSPSGRCGLAPEAEIYSYRVFAQNSEKGASNFSIGKAIDRAVEDGCHIINMSFILTGGASDRVLTEALDAARSAGTIVICAAGNGYRSPVEFPASYSYSIGVSAFGRGGTFPADAAESGSVLPPLGADPADFIADFSNVGPDIDFTGPGVGIISTFPGGYAVLDGTSMACPAVVGACARLLSTSPLLLAGPADSSRVQLVHQSLVSRAVALGFGANFEGHGCIQV